jgi:H+-transporting ATPase
MRLAGLTSAEASLRLAKFGPNEIPERHTRLLLALLKKFWGPIPWMLEATIIIQVLLRRRREAVIVGTLLAFNAIISVVEEGRANNALPGIALAIIAAVNGLGSNLNNFSVRLIPR